MAKIVAVDEYGIASSLGIKAGDELLSFNERPIVDVLDVLYYEGLDSFSMTIKSSDGITTYDIEKDYDEFLGIELEESCQLNPKRCKNKCKFCFVDQMPKGMRETLYVKDDDYRLSFISGNFITLTNCGESELKRIVDLKLSPIYVSVHATDPEVKKHLVANPEGAKTYEKLKYLTSNGIKINAQVVMCPNENDAKVLEKTLLDLNELRPMIISVAVVPVGLTKYREGLYPITPVSKEKARETIALCDSINTKYGTFIYPSDEFYVKADMELPSYDSYGDFDQIENGVGLIRLFEYELNIGISSLKKSKKRVECTFVTGVSFAPYLEKYVGKIREYYPQAKFEVVPIINHFFGESITVAGLITARDIISQLKGKVYKNMVIPSTMLREFTTTFLDGMSVEELEQELDTHIFVSRSGEHLVEIIENLK